MNAYNWNANDIMHGSIFSPNTSFFGGGYKAFYYWSSAQNMNFDHISGAVITVECEGFYSTFPGSQNTVTGSFAPASTFTASTNTTMNNPSKVEVIAKGLQMKDLVIAGVGNAILKVNSNGQVKDYFINDKELNKWINRIAVNRSLNGNSETVTDQRQFVENAAKQVLKNEIVLEYAKANQISITDDEVTNYFNDLKQSIMSHKEGINLVEEVTKGMGLKSYDELFEYDRDLYTQNVIWSKLLPKYISENPKLKDEDELSYQNRLVGLYQQDIVKYMGNIEFNWE
ncbi:hypothetical protein EXW96_01170 [Paenibacillus sp. JMULE4]|uniref:hypothetical protein n=1 Tax=Paenibacillus sp. JMULE4 TaxID=2518342 RepID=UPI0015758D61|nr:hypothetical protein [Paenibacillus sp. JMULE4]NTZ16243.1 hypothetical protein [Paenibacillus sp. JMULE4]